MRYTAGMAPTIPMLPIMLLIQLIQLWVMSHCIAATQFNPTIDSTDSYDPLLFRSGFGKN